MNSEEIHFNIAKLELRPGQILAVRFKQKLSADRLKSATEFLRYLVPDGVKVAVLDNDAEFVVIDHKV